MIMCDLKWATLEFLRRQTAEINQIQTSDNKARLDQQLTLLDAHVDAQIKPGRFLYESGQGPSEEEPLERSSGESDDQAGHEDNDSDSDDDEYGVEYDLSIFQGDGEIEIEGELIRVADWLGAEYTDRINQLQNVAPIREVSGLTTELKEWQRSGVAKVIECVTGPNRGCILGDEMGLGKTLTTLCACMMTESKVAGSFNLVITTTSCALHWRSEIIDHFKENQARVFILNDPKVTATQLLAGEYDFVICTYRFVQMQHRRLLKFMEFMELVSKIGVNEAKEKTNRRHWKRPILSLFSDVYPNLGFKIRHLILDEAQCAKSLVGQTHAAIKSLSYTSVIIIAGTFLANRWTDIYGLLDFLPGHPIDSLYTFLRIFSSRVGGKWSDPPQTKQNRLVKFLMAFTIARPSSLLALPGLEISVRPFSIASLSSDMVLYLTKNFYDELKRSGSAGGLESILTSDRANKALIHATQAQLHAAHPLLSDEKGTKTREAIQQKCYQLRMAVSVNSGAGNGSSPPTAVELAEYLEGAHGSILPKRQAGSNDDLAGDDGAEGLLGADLYSSVNLANSKNDRWREKLQKATSDELLSPRVTAILDLYDELRLEFPAERIVIFSKFLKFLDILDEALQRRGVRALRFDGGKSGEERKKTSDRFQIVSPHIPLLITAGSGGVGIDLTAGSKLIQCEIWWNGNAELQAYGRLYRQHQTKTGHIWKIECVNSVIDAAIKRTRDRKMVLNDKIAETMNLRLYPLSRGTTDPRLPIPKYC